MPIDLTKFSALPSLALTLTNAPVRVNIDSRAGAYSVANTGTTPVYISGLADGNTATATSIVVGGGADVEYFEGPLYAWSAGNGTATITPYALFASAGQPVNPNVLKPIAHPMMNDANYGAVTGLTNCLFKHQYYAPRGASLIQLVYPGWINTTSEGDTNITVNHTITAAIEPANAAGTAPAGVGSLVNITFGGAATGTLTPGANLTSDPIAITLPAGLFWIRTIASVASGNVNANGNVWGEPTYHPSSGEGYDTNPPGITDASLTSADQSSLQPLAVLGLPTVGVASQPSIAVIGDSIVQNSNEAFSTNFTYFGQKGYATGWASRALWGKFPVVTLQHGGYGLVNYVGALGAQRRAAMAMCDVALFQLGINDLINGQTLAQIQANMLNCWLDARKKGLRVVQCTMLPKPVGGSINYYTTQSNLAQTLPAFEATRQALNTWIRSQAVLVDLVLDVDAFADPNKTGFWPVAPNLYSGTASNASTVGTPFWQASVADSGSPGWTAGQWANPADGFGPYTVYIWQGTGSGTYGAIVDNAAATIQTQSFSGIGARPWPGATIDSTSRYVIVDNWSDSGIHPSPRGHAKIAAYAAKQLATIGIIG